jgi:molecular chaperone GrpE
MMEQPSDTVPGGSVLQTMQAGYELFGRTVRPAMVIVVAKGSGAQAAGQAYATPDTANGGAYDSKA